MSAEDQKIYAAVIGTGGVGTHFLSQLSLLLHTHPSLSPILISNSRRTILANAPSTALSLETWSGDLSSSSSITPALSIRNTLQFLDKLPGKRNKILIDNTSNADIAGAYPDFLEKGISIVTPNKKAFSGSLSLWRDIFSTPAPNDRSRGLCYHESTVGAGLPIISTLHDLIATGDRIHRIVGVFSGTMSFLFNTFAPTNPTQSEPQKWSAVVRTAKKLGYTEPDPRDDLNGLDVARKLVILARIARLDIESTSSFPVESLIPAELSDVQSGDEFLARLGDYDDQMEKVKENAEKAGKVVRYVGSIGFGGSGKEGGGKGELKVGLESFDKGDAIAGLKGSDNLVSFWTERYKERPLVVQGAGAGGAVTAMGVTADLIKVVQRIL